ncbi:nitrous oxide reductase family maturation protein NosD [Lutimonas zeaxanthinifaciens]|uniref:nitrous oxide reductase family maturation protein NosD n=1 Tax=Lutimonas zeaxanthinifaciens TaxID=3060215 RepID=UPI00265CA6DA|nr:nitrous oxide reductase family maturation protein NosD [Lutimonas sp. YSD2104]WKK65552.1 nitrous oxide reductase family maturation protein NosD [Lutimonas sp. YSD2104]
MKKNLLLIFGFFYFLSGYGNQIEVCGTCEVTTLRDAIEKAVDGDEIIIQPGVYKEHALEITKSLHITGVGMPVVDGEFKETIFSVKANNFSIKGLKIINVGKSYTKDFAAILVSKSEDFVIHHNEFNNVFFGILVEKSKRGRVENNFVRSESESQANSGNGIHLWHCSKMKVSNNQLTGLRDGIYFEFVKDSEVFGNNSYSNLRYGLHFMFSNDNAYFDNIFRDNGAGVAIMFSKFIKMYDNRFEHNWGTASYGLLLKEIYDAEIERNVFEQNTIGISVDGSTRINYTNNTFSRNGWAVTVIGACYENVFSKNDFLNNALDLSYNSKINTNRFENNYWSEYAGYDLDRNGVGDVPYRPVKLFSYIVHNTPETIILLRSMFVDIINFSEKVSPVFTPDNLIDSNPLMNRIND